MGKAKRNARNNNNNNSNNIQFLNQAIENNAIAQQEGPNKKKWNKHDIKTISPLTPNQEDMFHAWFNDSNIAAHGSAGTGKTFLAIYLALQDVVVQQTHNRIILVRSVVPTREVGFLPGTLDEKIAVYEQPYKDILWDLCGRPSTYQDMKDAGVISFEPTSFLRGLTWDNAIVIVDECANLTFHEIDTVMTRLGNNTRIIFTGDLKQTDLDGSKRMGDSGIMEFLRVINNMHEFTDIQFTKYDVVRSGLVKSWIMAQDNAQRNNKQREYRETHFGGFFNAYLLTYQSRL